MAQIWNIATGRFGLAFAFYPDFAFHHLSGIYRTMNQQKDGAKASGRRYGAPKNWRQTSLAALAESSNVTAAAACADISPSWVYKTRREDPGFARAWLSALCEGYDNLEMELLYRLRNGESKDTADKKFDNATALRSLIAHRNSVAQERALRDNRNEQEVLDSIDAMIDKMRERAAANNALLLEDNHEDS